MRSREGAIVGSATQAEPLPSAVRPTRLTAPVGSAWESRTPVELPRYSVATSNSAKPASTASRARARPNAPDSADNTSSSALESVSSGSNPKSRAGRASDGSTRGKASAAAGACCASARAAAAISATPPSPTSPVRRAEPKAPPESAMTLTERPRCSPLVVVVFSAKRTSTWLLSSTSTKQPSAPSASAEARPRSTSCWAGITVPTGSRATPEPPALAGPCRS